MRKNFSEVKKGDISVIENRADNVAMKAGTYEMEVVEVDGISFAVDSFDKWWFYKEGGHAYGGDASVIEIKSR